jgi:translation initiation factor 3 subunit A
VRIDHKNGTVHFGGLRLESDRLRDHIATLARRMAKAVTMIDPAPAPDKRAFLAKVGRRRRLLR